MLVVWLLFSEYVAVAKVNVFDTQSDNCITNCLERYVCSY